MVWPPLVVDPFFWSNPVCQSPGMTEDQLSAFTQMLPLSFDGQKVRALVPLPSSLYPPSSLTICCRTLPYTCIKFGGIRTKLLEFGCLQPWDMNGLRRNAVLPLFRSTGSVVCMWHTSGRVFVRDPCGQLPAPGQKWSMLGHIRYSPAARACNAHAAAEYANPQLGGVGT